MQPLCAFLYLAVFLLSALATAWFSRSAPSVSWIALELKSTLAVAWLFIALVLVYTSVYFKFRSHRGAIALAENTAVPPDSNTPTDKTTRLDFGASCLLVGLVFDAGIASFLLFKNGVSWAQNGDIQANAIAIMVFFLHGIVNCVGVCVFLYALHYGVKYILESRRGAATSDTDANIVNLEKGTQET